MRGHTQMKDFTNVNTVQKDFLKLQQRKTMREHTQGKNLTDANTAQWHSLTRDARMSMKEFTLGKNHSNVPFVQNHLQVCVTKEGMSQIANLNQWNF